MGGAPQVQTPQAPDTAQEYQQALDIYTRNAGRVYSSEAQYQPLYNQLQQQMQGSNINFYAQQYMGLLPQAEAAAEGMQTSAQRSQLQNMQHLAPQVTQALYSSNPAYGQLQNLANQQLAAGPDQTLTGYRQQIEQAIPGQVQAFGQLAGQVGADVLPVNERLQSLYERVGADTSAAKMGDLAQKVLSDQRGDIFNQTKANVMGALGQVDPLTQQLKTMAGEQLALGGSISQQEAQDVAQQARAAYSSRGMLNANASIGAELLNRSQYQQARLAQREQFGAGVSQLADQQAQQRVANALGLTSTDVAATLANQQLGGQLMGQAAGITQANVGLQSGLQSAIADNLARARQQQSALTGQAVNAYQTGMQQAAGLQGSILDQLYRQRQSGAGIMQYLTGASQQALSGIMGTQAQGANLATTGAALNAYGTGGPSLFDSSGILSLLNQNQMAQMNATSQANTVNAQSSGASRGALIGAGAGIAGALVVGAALL
jgi:hypothetical protein